MTTITAYPGAFNVFYDFTDVFGNAWSLHRGFTSKDQALAFADEAAALGCRVHTDC